jgi:pimeloyl-ACP methyl ester carboxylesterase
MKKQITFIFSLAITFAFAQTGKISIEQPVTVNSDTIRGTLVSPFSLDLLKKNKKVPLVIIIPGSGPTDRNGNSALAKGENNTFLQLADSLAKKGIASYRYDKLGIGKSSTILDESSVRFESNVTVVKEIYKHLNKELGFKKIFIMGHSEGSLIGMLATQELKATGYISVAGPAQNAKDVLTTQISQAPTMPENLKSQALEKLDSLHAGYQVKKFNMMLASLLRKSLQPYLIGWFKYTPEDEIQKIKKPILIVQGGRDLQVPEDQGKRLKISNQKADYLFYPNMNHVLKVVDDSREQNLAAYTDPDFQFPKTLVEDLSDWISKN